MALVSIARSANRAAPAEADEADGARARAGEPLGEVVTRHLREAILEGRLRPGARIRQEAVAREVGASRIPVREALLQLENEGLVSLVPRSGARVAKLDFAEYTELYRIREQLEPLAIAESAPRLSDAAIAQLRGLMLQIEQTREPAAWLALDRRFHLASYAAAPMPRLLKMIEGFWNSTQQYRRAFYAAVAPPHDGSLTGGQPLTVVEHRLLVDALERRDSLDAEAILRSHIRRTRLTLAGHQEVFDE